MKKIITLSGIFSVCLLMSSCMMVLPPEVKDLSSDIKEIKLNISHLQAAQGDVSRSNSTDVEEMRNKLDENFNYLVTTVNRLEESINAMNNDISIIRGQMEELKFALGQGGNPILSSSSKAGGSKPTAADTIFETAQQDYAKGNYESAIAGFTQFINSSPDSPVVPDANYWIGDCYYKLKQYDKSLEVLKAYVASNAQSNYAPEAYIKIALCYKELNQKDKYKETLNKITENYPSFDQMDRVKAMMKE